MVLFASLVCRCLAIVRVLGLVFVVYCCLLCAFVIACWYCVDYFWLVALLCFCLVLIDYMLIVLFCVRFCINFWLFL